MTEINEPVLLGGVGPEDTVALQPATLGTPEPTPEPPRIADWKILSHPIYRAFRIVDQRHYGMRELDTLDTIHLVVTRDEDRLVRMIKGWTQVRCMGKPPQHETLILEDLRGRLISVNPPPERKLKPINHEDVLRNYARIALQKRGLHHGE